MQTLAKSFVSAHQLISNDQYFSLTGAMSYLVPFRETGWDIDGNGIENEAYSYVQMRDLANSDRYWAENPSPSFLLKFGQI